MGELQRQVARNAANLMGDGLPPVVPVAELVAPRIDAQTAALAAAELALLSKGAVMVSPAMAAAPVSHR
jgi:hypothetical protein